LSGATAFYSLTVESKSTTEQQSLRQSALHHLRSWRNTR